RIARIVQQLEKAAGQAPGVGGAPSQDAAQVRETLAFGQEGAGGGSKSSTGKRPSRRKPSRPLPPL
ncbi:MAG: hypothetical protein Q8R59_08980, partial [Polaromonas sp.]|nr:hypothetical protein [Polaromonas sp.]